MRLYGLQFPRSDWSGYSQRDAYFSAAHYRACGYDCVAAVVIIGPDFSREVLPLYGPAQQPAGKLERKAA